MPNPDGARLSGTKFVLWNRLPATFWRLDDGRVAHLAEQCNPLAGSWPDYRPTTAITHYAVTVKINREQVHLIYASGYGNLERYMGRKHVAFRDTDAEPQLIVSMLKRTMLRAWLLAVVYKGMLYRRESPQAKAILQGLEKRVRPTTSLLIYQKEEST
jgi:hypothetical protein